MGFINISVGFRSLQGDYDFRKFFQWDLARLQGLFNEFQEDLGGSRRISANHSAYHVISKSF